MTPRTTAALATLVAATLTALTLPAATAAAALAQYADDFNGDGYRDLAVSDPSATVSGREQAGAVVVFYGSVSGISTTRRQTITQASAGIPGSPETGDGFGQALATGDLDGDGYADLLIGDPMESIGTDEYAGSVTVVWGGASGLGSGATIKPETVPDNGCTFGEGLAGGDTDGNGGVDVVVGSRCSAQYFYGPFSREAVPVGQERDRLLGTVHAAVVGNVDADAPAERVMLPGRYDSDPGGRVYVDDVAPFTRTELTHADGTVGAIGDVNGDGYGDLVLGDYDDPSADKPAGHRGGEISVWYGSASGIDPNQTPTRINQDTAGVPGTGEADDFFGYSISAADTNKDGFADVVVGAPGEGIADAGNAGSVTVLFGSAAGLSASAGRAIHQNSAGVSGAAEGGDAFGYTVDLADHNGDGRADLTVGAPGENGTGCTWNTRGVSVTGSFYVCADKLNLTGGAEGLGAVIAN